jgi:hypothetical protein
LAVIGKNHQLLSPVEKPTISRKPVVVTNQEENTQQEKESQQTINKKAQVCSQKYL